MPTSKDEKMLDWATQNPDDERSGMIMEKLGLDQQHMKMWDWSAQNPQDPRASEVRAKVFERMSQAEPPKSVGQMALDTIVAAGEWYDKYTGAPSRAALEKMIPARESVQPKQVKGVPMGSEFLGTGMKTPPEFGGGSFVEAGKAFVEQFGEDPKKAPTGKELAVQMGASTEETMGIPLTEFKFSPAGLAGLTIEMLADPTNLIPFSAAGKVISKGSDVAKAGIKETGKLLKKTPVVAPAVSSAAKITKKTVNDIVKAASPKLTTNYDDLVRIAKKNNIDPATFPVQLEMGPESFVGQLSRAQAEVDLAGELADKFFSSLRNTETALYNRIGKMSGKPNILSESAAGDAIIDGVAATFNGIFGDMAVTYKQLKDKVPGLKLSEKAAKKLVDDLGPILDDSMKRLDASVLGSERTQINQLNGAIGKIFDSVKNEADIEHLVLQLQSIGNAGYVSDLARNVSVPVDEKAFRQLYDIVKDSIIESVKEVDPTTAKNLIETNEKITQFSKFKNVIKKQLENGKMAPETLYRNVVANGDTKQLGALKEILPYDVFQDVKATYIEGLLKKTEEGFIRWQPTANQLKNDRVKLRLSNILTQDEIGDITELIRLGKDHGNLVLNTSGTGRFQFFRDLKGRAAGYIATDAVLDYLVNKAKGLKPTMDGLVPPTTMLGPPKSLIPPPPPTPRGLTAPSGLGRLPISTPFKPGQALGIQQRENDR